MKASSNIRAWGMRAYRLLRFLGFKGGAWLSIGAFSGLALSGVELVLAFVLQRLLYVIEITKEITRLPWDIELSPWNHWQLGGALIAVGLVRCGCNFLMSQSADVANEILSSRLKFLLFYETLMRRDSFQSLASVHFRLESLFPKAIGFCYYLVLATQSTVHGVALGVAIMALSWYFGVLALVGLLPLGWVALRINRHVKLAATSVMTEQHFLARHITRVVRNFFFLRVKRRIREAHGQLVNSVLGVSRNTLRARFLANVGGQLPLLFGTVYVVCLLLLQVEYGFLESSRFLVFLYLFMRFIQALGAMVTQVSYLNGNLPQFKQVAYFFFNFTTDDLGLALAPIRRINALGLQDKKTNSIDGPVSSVIEPDRGEGVPPRFEFDRVYFGYSTASDVIRGCSFSVDRGEQFAIMGKSGSGKSTLLALLLGVIEPRRGQVLVEGVNAVKYFDSPPINVGYVGAEPFLVEGTIRENLLFGNRKKYSDEDLLNALSLAQVQELREGAGGLDYRLSENGEGLSAGQKQRLCLARAFLGRPKLLILDEASANLDESTERQIAEVVRSLKNKCTVVIVSHRPGMVQWSDKTLKLN